MLTNTQAEIIESIIEVTQNPEVVTIKNRDGISRSYCYGRISASRPDLDKLQRRHLLSFRKGYCEPQITDEGLVVLRKFKILKLITLGLSRGEEFMDEKILKKMPDLNAEIIQDLLIELKEEHLVDGDLCLSAEDKNLYRFIRVWMTDQGRNALEMPDVWWNNLMLSDSLSSQLVNKPCSIESRFSQASFNKRQRKVAPELLSEALTYIRALRDLAQSLPDDRQAEVMTLLGALSQAVESPEQRCA